ncbi:MAG: thioredoxin family protein [Bacteroidota bacterium]|nr:thioredoxin family protein [Bacteroidota bacterium]
MAQFKSILVALLLLSIGTYGQPRTYTFQELDSAELEEARPILLFIHTDWCQYCQGMKYSTFQDKKVIAMLNENYYLVNFNPETEQPVYFNKKTYVFRQTGIGVGLSDLAAEISAITQNTSYPSIIIFDEKYQLIAYQNSFLTSKEMITFLINKR